MTTKRPFAIFAVIALICLVGIPAWAIWKRGSPSAAVQPISGGDATAQRLFQTNCGACHTLAAAGTDGVVAPNLDVLLATGPESKSVVDGNCARVLSAIDNGVGGRMPAGILQGEDAKLVANFVARNVAYVNNAPVATAGGSSSSTNVSASQVKCQTAPSAPAKGAAPTKPKPKPAPAPSGGASKLAVAADPSGMLKFDQTSLTATAGNVTVDFTNQAPLQHDFCIQQGTKQLGCTSVIQGSSTTKTFANLKPGAYTFYCSVDGHEAAGMKGALTVK
jgi:plastocyanin/mono/diheme cytochrome c family protein